MGSPSAEPRGPRGDNLSASAISVERSSVMSPDLAGAAGNLNESTVYIDAVEGGGSSSSRGLPGAGGSSSSRGLSPMLHLMAATQDLSQVRSYSVNDEETILLPWPTLPKLPSSSSRNPSNSSRNPSVSSRDDITFQNFRQNIQRPRTPSDGPSPTSSTGGRQGGLQPGTGWSNAASSTASGSGAMPFITPYDQGDRFLLSSSMNSVGARSTGALSSSSVGQLSTGAMSAPPAPTRETPVPAREGSDSHTNPRVEMAERLRGLRELTGLRAAERGGRSGAPPPLQQGPRSVSPMMRQAGLTPAQEWDFE